MELLKEILQIYMERREWFLELFGQHLKIAGIAIVLAGIMGLLLGIFIAEKEFMAPVILTLANIFYTIPSISLLGILIPFTGIGDKTAIIALTLYGLMPMIRNTYTGICGVSQEIIQAALLPQRQRHHAAALASRGSATRSGGDGRNRTRQFRRTPHHSGDSGRGHAARRRQPYHGNDAPGQGLWSCGL